MDKHFTIVAKRAPDGTIFVPFDHDPHPERPLFVSLMLSHLVQSGHAIEHRDGVPSHSGLPASVLGSHVILHSGPIKDTAHAH